MCEHNRLANGNEYKKIGKTGDIIAYVTMYDIMK